MNLARSSWNAKISLELDAESDSDIESWRVPEDEAPRTLISSGLDGENWRTSFGLGPDAAVDEDLPISPVGALTFKPTPGHYAKRRWSSDAWASKSTLDASSGRSEQSEAGETSYSDDDDAVDINVDYKKKFSVYYITQRRDADADNSSSGEEDMLISEVADKYALQHRASFENHSLNSFGVAVKNKNDSEVVRDSLVDLQDDNATPSIDRKARILPRQGFRVALSMSPGQSLILPVIN